MKRGRLTAGALSGCAIGQPARAQIAVLDAQSIAQEAKTYAVALQQVAQLAQQVQWTINTFNSWVQNPSLGAALGLINQAGMTDPLPVNPNTLQSLITGAGGLNGGLGALSGLASMAFGNNHVYTPDDQSWASQQMANNANGIAGAQGIAQQVYQQLADRYAVVQSLQQDLMTAGQTPAQREHIMGQLQAQQAWAQQSVGQLQAAQMLLVAQRENREQQADEQLEKSIDGQLQQARDAGIIP